VKAPASWSSAQSYRACALCTHGKPKPGQGSGDEVCTCPAVTGRDQADWPIGVPVREARANHGACGPEAHHLAFTGLMP